MIAFMKSILEGCGFFIYPLMLCSMVGLYVFIERSLSLRSKFVIPLKYWGMVCSNNLVKDKGDNKSVAGRIVAFFTEAKTDTDTLKAFIQLEVSKMERGLYLLDSIVTIAPLLGLLGTVVGLFQVFSQLSITQGMPESSIFVKGIALALTTTMMGLFIAIPAVFGSSYLTRKIEIYAVQINVLADKLINQRIQYGTQV